MFGYSFIKIDGPLDMFRWRRLAGIILSPVLVWNILDVSKG